MRRLRWANWHCRCPTPQRVPVALPREVLALLCYFHTPPEAPVARFRCRKCGEVSVPARAFGITNDLVSRDASGGVSLD